MRVSACACCVAYLDIMKVALVFLLTYSMMAITTSTNTSRTPPIPTLTETTEVSSVLLTVEITGVVEDVVPMGTVQLGLLNCVRERGQLAKTCNITPWEVTFGEVRTHSCSWWTIPLLLRFLVPTARPVRTTQLSCCLSQRRPTSPM